MAIIWRGIMQSLPIINFYRTLGSLSRHSLPLPKHKGTFYFASAKKSFTWDEAKWQATWSSNSWKRNASNQKQKQETSGQDSTSHCFTSIHSITKYMSLMVCRLRLPSQKSSDHEYSDSKFSAAIIKSLCRLRIVFCKQI